jgi:hypothetical protein
MSIIIFGNNNFINCGKNSDIIISNSISSISLVANVQESCDFSKNVIIYGPNKSTTIENWSDLVIACLFRCCSVGCGSTQTTNYGLGDCIFVGSVINSILYDGYNISFNYNGTNDGYYEISNKDKSYYQKFVVNKGFNNIGIILYPGEYYITQTTSFTYNNQLTTTTISNKTTFNDITIEGNNITVPIDNRYSNRGILPGEISFNNLPIGNYYFRLYSDIYSFSFSFKVTNTNISIRIPVGIRIGANYILETIPDNSTVISFLI